MLKISGIITPYNSQFLDKLLFVIACVEDINDFIEQLLPQQKYPLAT